jgi:hypothetical protein
VVRNLNVVKRLNLFKLIGITNSKGVIRSAFKKFSVGMRRGGLISSQDYFQ